MNNFIVLGLILFVLALNCQSVEPLQIGRDTGMTVLARLSDNSSNQSITNVMSLPNQTSQTIRFSAGDGSDLWSWGTIPIGYGLNKSGILIRLSDQEWVPSI
jgi:hypothetical protein